MILPSKKMLYSGTITGLRISAVDGTAFLDACAALVPYADAESDIYIYDSAGAFLKATLKAQGTGETLGDEAIPNNDMEADPITDWSVPATASMAIVADERDGGAGSQSIEVTRGTEQRMLTQDETTVSLTKGGSYKFSGWLKNVDLTTGNRGYIGFYTVGWASLGSYASPANSNTSWNTFSAYISVPDYDRLSIQQVGYGSSGQKARVDDYSLKQVLTPSTDGVTLQASKWDTTESFGTKASGFKYNEASYAVRVYKARG